MSRSRQICISVCCLHIDRQEGEKARKMSILLVVGGARTQFASNYEETDTSNRPLVPSCLLPGSPLSNT